MTDWAQEIKKEQKAPKTKVGDIGTVPETDWSQELSITEPGQQLSTPAPLTGQQKVMKYGVRPLFEGGGLMLGGVLGSGLGPAGSIGGAALGYSTGKQIANIGDRYLGTMKAQTPTKEVINSAKDEVGGQVLGKGIGLAGKAAQGLVGKLTGTGLSAVREALKGNNAFRAALRGKITGQEVVENAHIALNKIKDARTAIYQREFNELQKHQKALDLQPIKDKANALLKKYVRVDPATGMPDWSRSALGPENSEGVKKLKDIWEMVNTWGTKAGDDSIVGLDMLKRQLDDFYSESSHARAFVTSLRNIVKDHLVKEVPQYETMTKSYAEVTKLIKDIESNLMMRPTGISGRITADQTLRRLTSAMRDNFELRRQLVDILGYASSSDIAGQVAGHAMSPLIPRGLAGTGPSLVGQAAMASYVSPWFWMTLVASSPRVSGEFLHVLGLGMKNNPALSKAMREGISRAIAYTVARRPSRAQGKMATMITEGK